MSTSKPVNSGARRAAALGLSSSLALAAAAIGESARAGDSHDVFNSSAYTFCDAKLVGALYGKSPWDGKAIIGQKISNGIGDSVSAIRAESLRNGHHCDWADTSYDYDDAVALARIWRLGSPEEAKAKITWLANLGREKDVDRALGH
jgi:hypothetical protein